MDQQFEAESLHNHYGFLLVGPYICPSSAVILCNNLTYQICDTLWHFGPPTYTKPELIWIGNVQLSHFTIIMDEFLESLIFVQVVPYAQQFNTKFIMSHDNDARHG